MKTPEEVKKTLARLFKTKHRYWLACCNAECFQDNGWPVKVPLGMPTENQAKQNFDSVRIWVELWQSWRGNGDLEWVDRHWKTLGVHRLPEKFVVQNVLKLTQVIGQENRWNKAQQRYREMITQWPALVEV